MYTSTPVILGWIAMIAATTMLLKQRVALRQDDRRLIKRSPNDSGRVHDVLLSRMAHLDYWGMSLTIGIVLYGLALVIYSLYLALEKIAHALLRLISVF